MKKKKKNGTFERWLGRIIHIKLRSLTRFFITQKDCSNENRLALCTNFY